MWTGPGNDTVNMERKAGALALNRGFVYREQLDARAGGMTALEYLAGKYRHSTSGEWRKRLEKGEVLLDGRRAWPETVLLAGRLLAWSRPPWDEPDVPLGYAVLHRDEDLLAVAKPRGLPCVPAGGFLEHTLFSLVRRQFPDAVPAHRLGRGTSGVVLFARTQRARSGLSLALRSRNATKAYRALAVGTVAADEFTVEVPIGPVFHPRLGTLHAASASGKRAVSHVRVLERRAEATLLEVCIETGRPHQIRIHLAAAGHPLAGDPLYLSGGGFAAADAALPGDTGYLLHAERISLHHPATGRPLEVWCPPPPELRRSGEMPAGVPEEPGDTRNR